MKDTTLNELNDREDMDFSGFNENLKIHEMEMEIQEEREPSKKKAIAFRATSSIPEKDESMDEDEEKELSMLVKRLARYSKRRVGWATLEEENHKERVIERKRDGSILSLQEDGTLNCILSLFKTTSSKLPPLRR